MTYQESITSTLVPESERLAIADKLFGINYVLRLEPTVFGFAEQLAAPGYNGGYWQFMTLTNGGFYMAPRTDTVFDINCPNGFEGKLSADGLGVTACMYAYSHLSFGDDTFAETCAEHYHWLRELMMSHAEVKAILRAID